MPELALDNVSDEHHANEDANGWGDKKEWVEVGTREAIDNVFYKRDGVLEGYTCQAADHTHEEAQQDDEVSLSDVVDEPCANVSGPRAHGLNYFSSCCHCHKKASL